MLETTDVSIDAIAAEVGCTETAAFRRIFKRAIAVAPLTYRQRFRHVAAVQEARGAALERQHLTRSAAPHPRG